MNAMDPYAIARQIALYSQLMDEYRREQENRQATDIRMTPDDVAFLRSMGVAA